MNKNEQIKRTRELEEFKIWFSIGDELKRKIDSRGSTIKEACDSHPGADRWGFQKLYLAQKTARAFKPDMRNPEVAFTKHTSLSDVSRKSFPSASDDEWEMALMMALSEIHERKITVNELNKQGKAKPLIIECLNKLRA